ncbi:hypothetical protein G7048_08890 [Diaphorobacter sp. HDW4B]|uniref:hypothetical protein n=1 Tax=Diaphorobacter sp. HDW4B TaxID=2714925 RepID=UPI00140E9452|nr:hypothetical protein [Diaphorobacter sp. HDW4B]QIL70457.1 hypothetical protein G7048_08890 [Diaphorobacter sp. HDW4B]
MNMPRGSLLPSARSVAALAVLASVHWLACQPAIAQTASDPFIGRWTVKWDGKTKPEEADLEIAETGGYWQTYARGGENPCVGRRAPIERLREEGDKLVLVLRFSQALQGCVDSKIVLRATADGQLVGRRGTTELTVTRK